MIKVWLKFVVWTAVIGAMTRFIITRLTGQPFAGILAALAGGKEYLYFILEFSFGVVFVGSIIFGVWFLIAGRKRLKKKS